MEYMKSMESVFDIIVAPSRRTILSLLVWSQQSVGEIERQLRMPQPTVSKHLRVLREAGFVESTVDAQRRLDRLKPEPLQRWMTGWLSSAGSGPLM
jgi:DNA-binding transcriptional ArsR family regulator